MSAASIRCALGELGSVREDLDALTNLAARVAMASRDGQTVDHQTAVELVAHVAGAHDALDGAEDRLKFTGEGETPDK